MQPKYRRIVSIELSTTVQILSPFFRPVLIRLFDTFFPYLVYFFITKFLIFEFIKKSLYHYHFESIILSNNEWLAQKLIKPKFNYKLWNPT